jgi:hypothetical protein
MPEVRCGAATSFVELVSQMRFGRAPHGRPNIRRQPPEVFDSFGGKDDGEGHSGQIIARLAGSSNGVGKSRKIGEHSASIAYSEVERHGR